MIDPRPGPEQQPSLNRTIYETAAYVPSGNVVGQVQVAPKPTAGGQTADDLQVLLRRRLRTAFSIVAVILGLGVLLYFLNIALLPGPIPAVLWLSAAVYFAGTGIAVALTVLLAGQRPLSLGRLRATELTLVGLAVVICAWKQSSYLEGAPFIESFRGTSIIPLAGYHVLGWFALLTTYGLFVPNTWRRCTAVVVAIVLCPFVVLAVDLTRPECAVDGPALVQYLTVLGTWLVFGAALAIFGCHHLTALRRQASQARLLGQYQLKKRLGAGGMGEVYLAEHLLLRRPCAIKLIRPERIGDPGNLLRFQREARVTAALTHPNTVQVFDYGTTDDGTFYYVMEYLPGQTLDQLVERDGPLPAARAVHLLRQVCGALREAHAVGLIHRDIKPGNVQVCDRGGVRDVAKLLDFGLVNAPEVGGGSDRLTEEGTVMGTPAYMSPEQAAGTAQLDARSDVYSLGAVAYFLLTGRSPFAGRSAVRILAAHLYEAPAPLTEHRPDVPGGLQEVVLRCLRKNPTERFPDAESLELALAACPSSPAGPEQEATNR
jgi:serine/threonine-protein kinase